MCVRVCVFSRYITLMFCFLLSYCSLTLGQVFLECEKPSSYAACDWGSLIWQLCLSLT